MAFLAPLWLLALLPWTALAIWVLVGRRLRQPVPFLALWNAPEELRRPKRGFEPPPLSLILALLASLLALLAAAQPLLTRGPAATTRTLTVLVDRGATMSATGPTGQPRFVETAQALVDALSRDNTPTTLDVVTIPSSPGWQGPPERLVATLSTLPRTAVDADDELRAAMADPTRAGRPLLVLTDREVAPTRDLIIPIPPNSPVQNAGISALAHRPGQVMVTLSATHTTSRTLTLRSGDRVARQPVDLTPGQRNLFLNFDPPTDTIEARLEGADAYDADDLAWLTRRATWPTLEPRAALPEELTRFVAVYRRTRPPSEGSTRIAIGPPDAAQGSDLAVLLAPAQPPEAPRPDIAPTPHPVTANVDWSGLARGLAITPDGPPDAWPILLRAGDRPLVAVRPDAPRQAWIGFESREFARTPGFVVFWTNLFTWLGAAEDAESFTAATLREPVDPAVRRLLPNPLPTSIDPQCWPGLFESPAGKFALNSPAVTFPSPPHYDWQFRLASLPKQSPTGMPLSPWLCLAALACLAAAAATWERRRAPIPLSPA